MLPTEGTLAPRTSLLDRVGSPEEYQRLWIGYCKSWVEANQEGEGG